MTKVGTRYSSSIARSYIKENMDKKDKVEIVDHLRNITYLKAVSIENMYYEERAIRYSEVKEKVKERAKALKQNGKYKGRDRKVFYFDDSKLYKRVGEVMR